MLYKINPKSQINPEDIAHTHVVDIDKDTRWLEVKMRDGTEYQTELGGDPYKVQRQLAKHASDAIEARTGRNPSRFKGA